MSKKSRVFLALIGALTGGGFYLGDRTYAAYIKSARKEETPAAQALPEHARRMDVTLPAIDGVRLHATALSPDEAEEAARGADYALLLHDAKGTGADLYPYAAHYLARGMEVLIPDLRGCGKSEGAYLGYGLDDRLDVLTWVHRILKRDPDARILVHGVGAGAEAALLALAEHIPPAVYACVSDSAYTSLAEYLRHNLKRGGGGRAALALKLLTLRVVTYVKAGYDIREVSAIDAVRHAQTPTLFLHGDADAEVPVEMCTRLYNQAQCARQIGVFLSAGHAKSAAVSPGRYWSRVDAFIAKHHPDRT